MLGNRLTPPQMDQLRSFLARGDRYNYWNTLASFGDPYAKLALGVVTNETYSGAIANTHLAGVVAAAGQNLTLDLAWNIGVDLIKADYQARVKADGKHYVKLNNADPKPFIWSKTADDILASVERFCLRTSNSQH